MTTTTNELIGIFMGLKKGSVDNEPVFIIDGKWHDIDDISANYETSWDWLMPVVAKCEHINSDRIREEIGDRNMYGANIGIVHEAVVEFIKWYNKCNNEDI